MDSEVEWAGIRFLAVAPWDGGFFRSPGLYAFVHRLGDHRTLLLVDHADCLAAVLDGQPPCAADALRLGYNELNVAPQITERVDRLLLRGHIVRRCHPLLNLIQQDGRQDYDTDQSAIRRRTHLLS